MDDLKFYRKTPPIAIQDLAGKDVPFNMAVESLFYYSVHEKPSTWNKMQKAMIEWWNIVIRFNELGINHQGFDYPDWRQFALLDLGNQTRIHTRTRLQWFSNDKYNCERASYLYHHTISKLPRDKAELLSLIRNGLNSDKSVLEDFVACLIWCKHMLISGDKQEHDTFLPVYINIYTGLMAKFNLHSHIIKQNRFWAVHSTFHLWGYEVGQLEKNSFIDEESWLIADLSLLLSILY